VEDDYSPKPLGLSLGIFAVFVGQVFVLIYHFVRLQMFQFEMDNKSATHIPPVQKSGAPQYNYATGWHVDTFGPTGRIRALGIIFERYLDVQSDAGKLLFVRGWY